MAFKISRALMAGTMLAVLIPAPIVLAQSDSTNSNMQQSGDSTTWQNPDRIAEIEDESERIRAFSVLIGQSVYDQMLSAQAAQSTSEGSTSEADDESASAEGATGTQDSDAGDTATDTSTSGAETASEADEATGDGGTATDAETEGTATNGDSATADGDDASATDTGDDAMSSDDTGTDQAGTDSAMSSQNGSAMASAGMAGVTAVNVVDITQLLTPADVLALELLAEQNNVQVSQLQDFIELEDQLRTQLEDANFLPADVVAVQQSANGVIDLFVIPGWLNR